MELRILYKVRIIGAGSIGNHLAHSFVNAGFSVEVTDIDKKALLRMEMEIYPQRFTTWDNRIKLCDFSQIKNYSTDVLVIGTPPDTHLEVALHQLTLCTPRIILIEKPISHPDLSLLKDLEHIAEQRNIKILVGYNHRLTRNTLLATQMINDLEIGEILSITSQTRESWDGIMQAHPWLNGPHDSYLSSYLRGGGALYEHSHALNLLQYFMSVSRVGEATSVTATMELVKQNGLNYDRLSVVTLLNMDNKIFHAVQDFVTFPPLKEVRITGTLGHIIWKTSTSLDEVLLYSASGILQTHHKLDKSRSDDFLPEILHLKSLLDGEITDSPLNYTHALLTMKIISAAFESHNTGTRIYLK